jgi:hypothetical protein
MFEVRDGPSLERKKPSLGQPGMQKSFIQVEPASTLEGLVGFMFSPISDLPDGERETPSRTSNCLSSQIRTAGRGACALLSGRSLRKQPPKKMALPHQQSA